MRELSTEHARFMLESEGFSVDDIPTASGSKRADLRAFWDGEEYVIEAKFRTPRAGWAEFLKEVEAVGYATVSRRTEPWNALSGMVQEAYEQLVSTPAGADSSRILWIVALHSDDSFIARCVRKRLIGDERLVIIEGNRLGEPRTMRCYYHAFNEFERCPAMDSAVIGTNKGCILLVNYFSERLEKFRSTKLYQLFEQSRAVIDPEKEMLAGKALMLGDDFVGPRDGKAQWNYIFSRYRLRTSVMREEHFKGLVSVPASYLALDESPEL